MQRVQVMQPTDLFEDTRITWMEIIRGGRSQNPIPHQYPPNGEFTVARDRTVANIHFHYVPNRIAGGGFYYVLVYAAVPIQNGEFLEY